MNPDFIRNWRRTSIMLGVIIGLALVGILIILMFVQATPAAKESEFYGDIPYDAKLLAIDKVALDEAYHDQIKFLFQVWLKDGGRNVSGATVGLKNARSAYNYAKAQIAKREQQK